MTWTKPTFETIKMDAEIGSYQADDGATVRPEKSVRWQTPGFEEIKMDAEIGSYNADVEPIAARPSVATPEGPRVTPRRRVERRRTALHSAAPIALAVAAVLTPSSAAARGLDPGGTGWVSNEVVLSPTNFNNFPFHKILSIPVDDQIYAQPIVSAQLISHPVGNILSFQTNVLYVATMNDTVYAFDADSGIQYWKTLLGTPITVNDIPGGQCTNYSNKIGIASTPAFANGNLYVVYRIHQSGCSGTGCAQYFIAELNPWTGLPRFNPVQITGSVRGTGDGGSTVTFNPNYQNQRAAILADGTNVWVAFGSYCDHASPGTSNNDHGWVFAYDATTLAPRGVYNTTPNGSGGTIWQSGGAALGPDGTAYFATANLNANGGSFGDAQTVIGLATNGTTITRTMQYIPTNQVPESNEDADLGASSPVLPGNGNFVQMDKLGNLFQASLTPGRQSPAPFLAVQNANPAGNKWVTYNAGAFANNQFYVWGRGDVIRGYPLDPSTNHFVSSTTTNVGTLTANSSFYPAGGMTISSNGTQNGVVWATAESFNSSADPGGPGGAPGVLFAYNANNLGNELWDSTQASGDALGTIAKWVPPTVANGKVYVATFDNQVLVYANPPVFDGGVNYDFQFSPIGDWDFGSDKGECPYGIQSAGPVAFQPLTGMSAYPPGVSISQRAHDVLCSTRLRLQSGGLCITENFDNSMPASTWDFDVGYEKAECPTGYAVNGVSQTQSGAMDKLLCCPTGIASFVTSQSNCVTEVLWNQNSADYQAPDWDFGFDKAECPETYVVSGVSSSVSFPAGAPHGVLCCQP